MGFYKIDAILNTILEGDILENLSLIPTESVDLIFADPPYFMQTEGVLIRSEGTTFSGIDDDWDKFDSYAHYDSFSIQWLTECRRILKKNGTIWVIGAFQNIYRLGYIMQNLGFWILNDIVWAKSNPVPNFRGTRFTNANETLLWCTKNREARYVFNYKTMKDLNGGKQMRSIWPIALCTGQERLKTNEGKKAHNAQKPEELLHHVILSSSHYGDIICDPFMGTGTTGAVAKRLGRHFIGIERNQLYRELALARINKIITEDNDRNRNKADIKPSRVSVKTLISMNYLNIGESLYDHHQEHQAVLRHDGQITYEKITGSIHHIAAQILQLTNHNGWDYWNVKRDHRLVSLAEIRAQFRLSKEDQRSQ
jgi:site-specific DNA-methyltransferase (adenine-specific)